MMEWMQRVLLAMGARAPAHLVIGRRGERLAARHLKRQGFRIMHRNLRVLCDEADLVAMDPDGLTLVLIEVKTRTTDYLPPEISISREKQRSLLRLGGRLLQRPQFQDHPLRFDVVSIYWPRGGKPEVRHHPGAFV